MNEQKKYKLRVLPLFEDDLNGIVDYMLLVLHNPVAANRFVDKVYDEIQKRLPFAESFEQYHSVKEHDYPYYRIYVGNYTVFYVVIGNVMEIRRIILSRRNIKEEI